MAFFLLISSASLHLIDFSIFFIDPGCQGFLFKKLNPGSIKNIEKTTKCKIADKINKKRISDRVKQLKKDRELEEMLHIANSRVGSTKKRDIMLDWMYDCGFSGKSETSKAVYLKSNLQDRGHFTHVESSAYNALNVS